MVSSYLKQCKKAIELCHLLSRTQITRDDVVLWEDSKHVNLATVWRSMRRHEMSLPWITAVWLSCAIPRCSFFYVAYIEEKAVDKGQNGCFWYECEHHMCVM